MTAGGDESGISGIRRLWSMHRAPQPSQSPLERSSGPPKLWNEFLLVLSGATMGANSPEES
eukprot:7879181-Pyramimonas_sp.AAC.1